MSQGRAAGPMLFLALSVISCASQKSSESHTDYTASLQTVRQEGPEKITVLEFESGPSFLLHQPTQLPGVPGAAQSASAVSAHGPLDNLPDHGPLIKATITERSPVTTTTKAGTEIKAEAESTSRWRIGPGFWGWVAIGGGAALALFLAVKFRAGLLGGVLKLIGRQ